MRTLVFGGSGFIGSNLVLQLLHDGHKVTRVSRKPGPFNSNTDLVGVCADVNENLSILDDGELYDSAIFLANATSHEEIMKRGWDFLRCHTQGLENAMCWANRLGVRRFVYASSGKVYGGGSCLAEHDPVNPTTHVGRVKLLGENIINTFQKVIENEMHCTIARIFNVYGPGQSDQFVISKISKAVANNASITLGPLNPLRDFIHVADVASILSVLLEDRLPRSMTVNVCSGHPVSISDLVKWFGLRNYNVDTTLARKDEKEYEYGSTNTLEALGIKLSDMVPLTEGIADLIEYYRNHS